jgi:AcrR family transcriptional regulator
MSNEKRLARNKRRAKRSYRMTRRAEQEEKTRVRITESAVELHGTIGPARTSISALAAYAGVRRSTVYRHFPDEAALFTACSSLWLAANPLPDVGQWVNVQDVDQRLRQGLQELYAYYRRTEHMMTNVLRDEAAVPILTRMLTGYRQYLSAAREVLMKGRNLGRPTSRRVGAVIGHALGFQTWHSLAIEQGLDDEEIATLMKSLVVASSKSITG